MLRKLGLNSVLVVASCVVSVLLLEILLRVFGMHHPRVWEPDPRLGWRHIPGSRTLWTDEGRGHVVINALGYRDRERQLQKPPGVFRIAVLGDSMTAAVQVDLEQTFCFLLEERLRQAGYAVEVLNFGVNGYSPVQELLVLQQEGPRYKPDLVIAALFLDNDVSGSHVDLSVAQTAGPPYLVAHEPELRIDYAHAERSFQDYHREPLYSLRKYSALYRSLSAMRWQRARQGAALQDSPGIPQRYKLYQVPLTPVWEAAWALFEKTLRALMQTARTQQVSLVFLSVPAAQVVHPPAWQNILTGNPAMRQAQWDLEGPERRLAAFGQQYNVPVVPAYKVYQQASQGPRLFFGDVGHMTEQGHQLMTDVLRSFLDKNGLLPRK